jgi:hypothetical protein
MLLRLGSLAVTLALLGCGNECSDEERVQVTFPATVEFESQSTVVDFKGEIAPGNLDAATFAAVRNFLTQGPPATGGAVWTVSPEPPNSSSIENVAIQLLGPLNPGDVVDINTAFNGGGWGAPLSSEPAIAVSSAAFVASSATGTVEVLGVGALRLAVDVLTANSEGKNLRLRGEMVASSTRTSVCD